MNNNYLKVFLNWTAFGLLFKPPHTFMQPKKVLDDPGTFYKSVQILMSFEIYLIIHMINLRYFHTVIIKPRTKIFLLPNIIGTSCIFKLLK